MIYFDNAASSYQKPLCVVNSMRTSLLSYTANPGRSGHHEALKAEEQVFLSREELATFLNAPRLQNIIFTQNCTDALNLAILGSSRKYGHVITTTNEHNSILRPLFYLQREGKISLSIVKPQQPGKITLSDIAPYLRKNTFLIATTHISNVDGTITDAAAIGKFCQQNNILYLLDAAQSAGHLPIDMKKLNADMVAIAGHKGVLGPQGIGVLALSERAAGILNPIRFGGTGTESANPMPPATTPERFECGTLSTPAIIGLREGVRYVKEHFAAINRIIQNLSSYLLAELGKFSEVELYTIPENNHGVISFNIKNWTSTDVADNLNENYGICTRGGLHCAPLKHKDLGTLERGAVRVSLSYANTVEECDIFLDAIKNMIS